jgi:phage baseplate assembly protein W
MPESAVLGKDLDLGFVADEEGRTFAGPYSRVDLQAKERGDVIPHTRDLGVAQERANLVQSLILRLKTARGELAALGHPAYGSRHHDLIGQPNTEGNCNLVKLYILECLQQEPRVEIEQLTVTPGEGRERRDQVDIFATLRVKGDPIPLNLVVPFSFEGSLV